MLLTPPVLPAALQMLRAAWLLRLLRLLRVLRLVRTVSVVRVLVSAEGIKLAAMLALATCLGGGAAFAQVEHAQHLTAWDGPTRARGVMLVGIGFVDLVTAAVAQRFIALERKDHDRQVEILERLGRHQPTRG